MKGNKIEFLVNNELQVEVQNAPYIEKELNGATSISITKFLELFHYGEKFAEKDIEQFIMDETPKKDNLHSKTENLETFGVDKQKLYLAYNQNNCKPISNLFQWINSQDWANIDVKVSETDKIPKVENPYIKHLGVITYVREEG